MLIYKSISVLKISAILLFITSLTGIVGSLLFHNYLVSYNYKHETIIPFTKIETGSTVEFTCTEKNQWCDNLNLKKISRLDQCNKFLIKGNFYSSDGLVKLSNEEGGNLLKNKKTFVIKYILTDQENEFCILNNKSYYFYKIIPGLFEYFSNNNFTLGTSKSVNPIIYGETSISNIVKRYPINVVFEVFMYLSIVLMIVYWFFYNKVLNEIFNKKDINRFLIFGIFSSIFLFLHVFFLGDTYEIKILNQIRRSYIIFFILFEVFAQIYLLKYLWKKRESLKDYLNRKILLSKLFFIIFVCFCSLIILSILVFYDFTSKIDYILEWNYFLILLIYYLLTFLIWKKSIFSNPSTA